MFKKRYLCCNKMYNIYINVGYMQVFEKNEKANKAILMHVLVPI